MKKFTTILCAAALIFTSACNNSGGVGGYSSYDYIGECTTFNTSNDNITFLNSNAKVTVAIPNSLEPKFDFGFHDMKFAENMPSLDIAILGIDFTTTISEDQTALNYIFDTKDSGSITPYIGDIANPDYKIKRVWGCVGRYVTINFELEASNFRVVFTNDPAQLTSTTKEYTGTSTTTNTQSGEVVYQAEESTITVVTRGGASPVATITFNGIKFAEAMPSLIITLPNIPTTTAISTINFDTANIIPTIGGVEYENYKMSRVWGSIGETVEVNFTMAEMPYSVVFTNNVE